MPRQRSNLPDPAQARRAEQDRIKASGMYPGPLPLPLLEFPALAGEGAEELTQIQASFCWDESYTLLCRAVKGTIESETITYRFSFVHSCLTVGASLASTGSPFLAVKDSTSSPLHFLWIVASVVAAVAAWALFLVKGPERVQREEAIREKFALLRDTVGRFRRALISPLGKKPTCKEARVDLETLARNVEDVERSRGSKLSSILMFKIDAKVMTLARNWLQENGHAEAE